MSKASDPIERLERETGQRIDETGSMAMLGLLGAMSRIMGKSPASYTEKDDVAAGIVIAHRMTPEYEQEQQANEMIAQLLVSGMSPEDVSSLLG